MGTITNNGNITGADKITGTGTIDSEAEYLKDAGIIYATEQNASWMLSTIKNDGLNKKYGSAPAAYAAARNKALNQTKTAGELSMANMNDWLVYIAFGGSTDKYTTATFEIDGMEYLLGSVQSTGVAGINSEQYEATLGSNPTNSANAGTDLRGDTITVRVYRSESVISDVSNCASGNLVAMYTIDSHQSEVFGGLDGLDDDGPWNNYTTSSQGSLENADKRPLKATAGDGFTPEKQEYT